MPAEKEDPAQQLFGKQLLRKILIPTLVALVAYVALLLYGDAPSVVGALRALPASALAVGVGISVVSLLLRAVRWHLYLLAVGIAVPLKDSAFVFGAGLGMSITPGKVGELLKSLMLKQQFDIPVVQSGPVIIAERLMDLVSLLLLGGVSLGYPRWPVPTVAVAALGVAALFAFGRSQRLGQLAVSAVGLLPPLRKFREKLLAAHASLRDLWSARSFVVALSLSLLAWGIQALTVSYFANAAAGVHLSLPSALIAYSAPLLAGALALIPGGLGLTEASMAGALRALSGMSTSSAVAVTILTRVATFWVAVLLGLCAFATWQSLRRRRASAAPSASP